MGATLLALGSLAALSIMGLDTYLPRAPLWGGLAIALAAAGILELMGLLRARASDPSLIAAWCLPQPDEPAWMAPRWSAPLAGLVFAAGTALLGVAHLPWVIGAALAALLPSALRRPPLFVFCAGSLLMLPWLGAYGLWDPWETHYGEVAREILARRDWVTLWWAQEEWFRSKPVLIFWIEALTWGALGIPFKPDSNPDHVEWALRLPIYALSMGALLASYAAMARIFGRRAGVLAALVLSTTPYFFFLSHQAITDMPFVATMTFALAMLLIALEEPDDRHVQRYRIGPVACSLQGLLVLSLVAVALPQALYLVTRNLDWTLSSGVHLSLHRDAFMFGSALNHGIPGNPATQPRGPYLSALWTQPMAQGILWLAGLSGVLWMIRRETRSQQLAMFAFYLGCSSAWMAKGIPGFALPGLIALFYLLATNRLGSLTAGKLRIAAGALVIAVTGLPWYVAMYGRLGPFFTDRLLIHDHINRLASGVHGDTGSVQYFLWQLGYGAFPWLGLAPTAFASFSNEADEARAGQRRSLILLAMWWIAAFTLFNAMITKFHHYIFPMIPPLAMAVGILLDRMLGDGPEPRGRSLGGVALAAMAPVPLVLGTAGLWGDVRGVVPEQVDKAQRAEWILSHPWHPGLCAALIAGGLLLGLAAVALLRGRPPSSSRGRDAACAATLTAGAVLTAFAGRDLSWSAFERPFGHERLIHLFVYNYHRPFPDYLDYRPILTGFTVVLTALLLAAAWPLLRKAALYAVLGCAFLFSVFCLDVYLIDLAPHWSQRALIKRYYAMRRSPSEPLVAWQMNWKGENLYTGNRVHVFVQLNNREITKWLDTHRAQRAYFVLEHGRLASFRRLMGTRRLEELSTARENNKFILVRAEI